MAVSYLKKTQKRGGAMAELLSRHNDHKAKNGDENLRRELYEKELIRQKKKSIMAEIQLSEDDLGDAAKEPQKAQTPAPEKVMAQTAVQAPVQAPSRVVPPQAPARPQPKAVQKQAPQMRQQRPMERERVNPQAPHQSQARVQQRPQTRPAVAPQAAARPQRREAKKTNNRFAKIGLIAASIFLLVATIVTVTVLIMPKGDGNAVGFGGMIQSVSRMFSPAKEEAPKAAEVSIGAFEEVMGEELDRVSLSASGGEKLQLVYFNIYGSDTVSCMTDETTVGSLIDEMGITLNENQVVRESTENATMDGKIISIDTVTYATETHTERIDYNVKYVDVQFVPRGQEQVHFKGSSGESTTTYNIKYVNGEVAEKTMVSEAVTKSPLTQVVYRGVGGTITIGGKSYSYSHYIDCKTTVYCLEGITASGKPVGYDVIAVDPRVIPLGTQVYVDDPYTYVGFRTAADTGGAIKGNFIDIWFKKGDPKFSTYGVRSARVYILD